MGDGKETGVGAEPFSTDILRRNLAELAAAAPEVARWLEVNGEPRAAEAAEAPPAGGPPADHRPQTGGITVVVGGGLLDTVHRLVRTMPPGHQVFVLEPRAARLARGLGRFDLSPWLREGDLVILAPHEAALEEALSRHPQLALAEQVEFLHLAGDAPDSAEAAVWARLYRVLGQALKARDLALRWEEPRGANLVGNLAQAAFMGRAPELAQAAAGRPAVVLENGPGLGEALERLAGHAGGAVVLCSDEALPLVLESGLTPSAAVTTRPVLGRLSCYCHPALQRVPLVAEELAHAPTLRAHPGPRFVCLGARGTALGPLRRLAGAFTPQQHTLGRQVELALFLGCRPVVLAGAELTTPGGRLALPAMDGGRALAELEQAAAACSLGQVLARAGRTVLAVGAKGQGLPGARLASWEEVLPLMEPGQPLGLDPVAAERWLTPAELEAYAGQLRAAAGAATRLWQRAAAPLADFPPAEPDAARPWLSAADRLFVALAEQAAADPLQAAFLEGCLVRAFLRRHRLVCRTRGEGMSVREVSRDLGLCLADLEARARALARGVSEAADTLAELAQALAQGDRRYQAAFARRMGRG
jgi:hypothetical protein